jgi:hypothetical protein
MASNEELARKLFREARRAVGDEAVADKINDEERERARRLRDAHVPRPKLKFDVEREGKTFRRREEIFDMLEDMNLKGTRDDVQYATILRRFPEEVNKSSLHELIDGTSNCSSPRNAERLRRAGGILTNINSSA